MRYTLLENNIDKKYINKLHTFTWVENGTCYTKLDKTMRHLDIEKEREREIERDKWQTNIDTYIQIQSLWS